MALPQPPGSQTHEELSDEELANLADEATNSGDEQAFIKTLSRVRNINTRSKCVTRRTLLASAARCGLREAVRLILERPDVDVNAKDKDNKTALQLAMWQGHEEITMRLLERPDVDSKHNIDDLLKNGFKHQLDDAVLHLLTTDPRMYLFNAIQQTEVISRALSKDPALARILITKSTFIAHNDGYSPKLLHRILRCKSGNLRKCLEGPATSFQNHLDGQYHGLVEALLKRAVDIKEIEASTWLSAYRREQTDTVQITHTRSGVKEVSFLNQEKLERRIRLYEKECEGEVASSPSRQNFL